MKLTKRIKRTKALLRKAHECINEAVDICPHGLIADAMLDLQDEFITGHANVLDEIKKLEAEPR
jgi:hypothetical protein